MTIFAVAGRRPEDEDVAGAVGLMSQPIAVPVDSVPLTWIGVGPSRPRPPVDEGRVAVVPAGVEGVLERRGRAVVDPQHLLVGAVWVPEKVVSKVQVAPAVVDL